MAITWTTYWTNPSTGHYERQSTLYTAAAATNDGEWFSGAGLESINVLSIISATATVAIDGNNDATVPANATDGNAIVTDVTATGYTQIQQHQIPRWIKIHLKAFTSGTVDVDIKVRGRALGNVSE